MNGIWYDVADNNMRVNLKWAAKMLNYPDKKVIPTDRIDIHSLHIGGANPLALSGCSDCQIRKNGAMAWCLIQGVHSGRTSVLFRGAASKDTNKQFGLANIAAGLIRDITNTVIINDNNNTTAEAA